MSVASRQIRRVKLGATRLCPSYSFGGIQSGLPDSEGGELENGSASNRPTPSDGCVPPKALSAALCSNPASPRFDVASLDLGTGWGGTARVEKEVRPKLCAPGTAITAFAGGLAARRFACARSSRRKVKGSDRVLWLYSAPAAPFSLSDIPLGGQSDFGTWAERLPESLGVGLPESAGATLRTGSGSLEPTADSAGASVFE